MKTNIKTKTQIVAASLVLLAHSIGSALADGTETLGTPSIQIQSGSGIVAEGVGLVSQPGAININVPGTVKQVLLYWEGQSIAPNPGDGSIIVNGNPVNGTLIGGPTLFFSNKLSSTFRADITGLNLVATGDNTLIIEGLDFGFANNGAGVMVIYDDGSTAGIQIRDGNDLAFQNFVSPLNATNAQTFTFAAENTDRHATLPMFFSSVDGSISGNGFDRPNAIEVTVGGSITVYNNLLQSNDGDEWDTRIIPVIIPAGATALTVHASSVDNLNTGNLPASFAWNAAGLTIPETPNLGGEGCTPGFWKQTQHFDSWTLPYTPSTPFSAVFENAFPGKTLAEVLDLGGGGLNALGRHSVAALLNAASSNVSSDQTVSEVINQFNSVYPGTNSAYETLKNKFAAYNELGCPLN